LFLSGQVDDRTIQKYEKEAKDKSRESWLVIFMLRMISRHMSLFAKNEVFLYGILKVGVCHIMLLKNRCSLFQFCSSNFKLVAP
jgi:hypothetical protein